MARRPVPPRRPTGPLDQLAGQITALRDDLRGDIARLEERVERTDARVDLGIKGLGEDVGREISHLNNRIERFHDAALREIELVRADQADHELLTAEGAARGAAAGVASVKSSRTIGFWSDWKGWAVTVCAFLITAGTLAEKLPKFIKLIEALWKAAGGGT
ncbi:hypothetical protein [Phenylobacterium sp.]|uniref:hypothetical protein n=1 Tax=Phenylobacterium sp. TaxID=1871053 RepID=UPI002733E3C9|nr:hypothetical protein [Phenylobacterium sp.]MDP3853140.1 hypothetical protein [Phenylobacterium sp.]